MHDDPNATAGPADESGQAPANLQRVGDLIPAAGLDPDRVRELLELLRVAVNSGRTDSFRAAVGGLLTPNHPLDNDAVSWAVGWLRDVEQIGADGVTSCDAVLPSRAPLPEGASGVARLPLFVGMPPRYQDPD